MQAAISSKNKRPTFCDRPSPHSNCEIGTIGVALTKSQRDEIIQDRVSALSHWDAPLSTAPTGRQNINTISARKRALIVSLSVFQRVYSHSSSSLAPAGTFGSPGSSTSHPLVAHSRHRCRISTTDIIGFVYFCFIIFFLVFLIVNPNGVT